MESVVVAEKTFKLLSVKELINKEPPEWLISGLIECGALGVLYGASSSGKSFVALDVAMCVATGATWQGRAVKKGRVVYVVGEGTPGIGKRVRAWLKENGVEDVSDAFFLLQAPQFMNNDVEELIRSISDVKPGLVVIDTLASSFVGGEENSAKDMGRFVDGCRKLQRDIGAAVLVVHHKGKGKEAAGAERGSSALRGAADAMFEHTRDDKGVITLRNDKQKDDEKCEDIKLGLKQVVIDASEASRPITSCVVVGSVAPPTAGEAALSVEEQTALDALAKLGSASSGDWRKTISELGLAIPSRTFQHRRRALVEKHYVETVPGKRNYYRLTEQGCATANGMPAMAA